MTFLMSLPKVLRRTIGWKYLGWSYDSLLGLCYGLKPLESDNRTTFVLSNTRELDRELFYKLVYLI